MAEGGVRLLLRLEGVAMLIAGLAAYGYFGQSWWLFTLLVLLPDIAFLAYLRGPRLGANVYNALHTTLAPLALALFGFTAQMPIAYALAAIWLSHIGFDRALGYGLKYASAFGDTHLGRIGRR